MRSLTLRQLVLGPCRLSTFHFKSDMFVTLVHTLGRVIPEIIPSAWNNPGTGMVNYVRRGLHYVFFFLFFSTPPSLF
jgi:hypothetical protein